MYHIYKVTNQVNSKVYIGLTARSPEERFSEHVSRANSRNKKSFPLNKAIKKYGKDSFNIEIIESLQEESAALQAEKKWIKRYDSYKGEGYNAHQGGHKTAKSRDMDKTKLSEIGKKYGGRASTAGNISSAAKKKISEKTKGEKCGTSEYSALEVAQVKWLAKYSSNMSHKEIGSIYGMSRKYVGKIKRGIRWPHIDVS